MIFINHAVARNSPIRTDRQQSYLTVADAKMLDRSDASLRAEGWVLVPEKKTWYFGGPPSGRHVLDRAARDKLLDAVEGARRDNVRRS